MEHRTRKRSWKEKGIGGKAEGGKKQTPSRPGNVYLGGYHSVGDSSVYLKVQILTHHTTSCELPTPPRLILAIVLTFSPASTVPKQHCKKIDGSWGT